MSGAIKKKGYGPSDVRGEFVLHTTECVLIEAPNSFTGAKEFCPKGGIIAADIATLPDPDSGQFLIPPNSCITVLKAQSPPETNGYYYGRNCIGDYTEEDTEEGVYIAGDWYLKYTPNKGFSDKDPPTGSWGTSEYGIRGLPSPPLRVIVSNSSWEQIEGCGTEQYCDTTTHYTWAPTITNGVATSCTWTLDNGQKVNSCSNYSASSWHTSYYGSGTDPFPVSFTANFPTPQQPITVSLNN